MMKRRHVIIALFSLTATLALAGCGGTNKATTSGSGRLRDVDVSPVPGATFLPRTSDFTIFWSAGAEPPPTFTARIYRLQPDESIDEITTNLTRPDSGAFRWLLRPTSDLPVNSAIYLELTAPGESTLRFAYIVGTSRAQSQASPLPPGGVTAKRHTITVR